MQITFDFEAKRIVLDGAEQELLALIEAARKIAPHLPQLTVNSIVPVATPPGAVPKAVIQQQDQQPPGQTNGRSTMRDFVRSLKPKSHSQKIASMGYFVKQYESKPGFSPKELDGWYVACGFQKPASFPVALSDARKVRFVTNVGYGQWKVDRDGDNWVINRIENPVARDESAKE